MVLLPLVPRLPAAAAQLAIVSQAAHSMLIDHNPHSCRPLHLIGLQLAAQAKRWAAWLEGNVTQAELAGEACAGYLRFGWPTAIA